MVGLALTFQVLGFKGKVPVVRIIGFALAISLWFILMLHIVDIEIPVLYVANETTTYTYDASGNLTQTFTTYQVDWNIFHYYNAYPLTYLFLGLGIMNILLLIGEVSSLLVKTTEE